MAIIGALLTLFMIVSVGFLLFVGMGWCFCILFEWAEKGGMVREELAYAGAALVEVGALFLFLIYLWMQL